MNSEDKAKFTKITDRVCKGAHLITLLVALAAILVALLAEKLGLDPDGRWGEFRIAILFIGLVMVLTLLIDEIIYYGDRKLMTGSHKEDRVTARKILPNANSSIRKNLFLKTKLSRGLILFLAILLIELLYLWIASGGFHLSMRRSVSYYNLLADAFLQGRTSLLITPPPELQTLDNPWALSERAGIPVIRDASYYQGKYYLYWGPAPAVLVAGWKLITNTPVGDQFISFAATSFVFLFSILSLISLRRRFFPTLPDWLFACLFLFIATTHPMLWNLNQPLLSFPSIYYAAIASGQAFLLCGFYIALPILYGLKSESWRFFVIGILWSGAIASRITLAGTVAVFSLATILQGIWRSRKSQRVSLNPKIFGLVIPIVITLVLLMLYNYIRFGNINETGVRYQLGGINQNQLVEDRLLISPRYLPANLFYYLTAPLKLEETFPFIRPSSNPVPGYSRVVSILNTPTVHFEETATGLLSTLPLLLIVIPAGWKMFCSDNISRHRRNSGTGFPSDNNLDGTMLSIFGSVLLGGLVAMAPLLVMPWVGTRYLLDITPLLALSTAIAIMYLYTKNSKYPLRGRATMILVISLLMIGVIVGFLLGLSGNNSLFDDLNPEFYQWMNTLFSK